MNRKLSILAALLVLAFAGCKPPAPPPAQTQPTSQPAPPPKPMAFIVPGLGNEQTGDVVTRLQAKFGDRLTVVNFGTGRNSYLSDIRAYAAANPHAFIIVIGHSYGTDKIDQAWAELGDVRLAVLLDPVPEELFGEFNIPANVRKTIVITGDFSGLFRAKINGDYDEYKIHKGHSAMAHDATTLAIIQDAVSEAL